MTKAQSPQPSKHFVASLLFLLLALFGSAVTAFGQASLSGTVKDSTGAAIAGATVTARNSGSGNEATASTDSSGKYELKNLSGGVYRLTASSGGFSDVGVSLSVDASGSTTQDFTLSAGSLQDEVTVTATKSLRANAEIPQSVTTISAADLEQRRPIGLADAYDKTPSVQSIDPNPQRTRPIIRGMQATRLLITVDGERLNNARFGADSVGVSPSLIDPTQVQSIEVVAGPGSSLYGSDAVGGTINIITRGPERIAEGRRLDARLDADYSSNGRYRRGGVSLGYGEDWFAVRVNYTRFRSTDFHMGNEAITQADVLKFGQLAVAAGRAAPLIGQGLINSYPVYSLPGKARISPSGGYGQLGGVDFALFPSERQTLRLRYQANRYGNLGVPFSEFPGTVNRVTTLDSKLDKFSARYEVRDVAGWLPRISASMFWQKYPRSVDENRAAILPDSPPFINSSYTNAGAFTGKPSAILNSAEIHTVQSNETTGFDIQFNIIPWKRALYITGINHSYDRSRDNFNQVNFSLGTPGSPPPGTVTSRINNARNTPFSDFKNYGWYNQLEYSASKHLLLTGGFRVDNWKTEAKPTAGYPVGRMAALSQAILTAVRASTTTSLSATGLAGIGTLTSGTSSINTSNTKATYNVAATVLLGGFNPYVRFATSFREPDIIARYLLRDFSSFPFFSVPQVINSALKPERGKNIDVGVKVSKQRFRGSLAYYRNVLDDATGSAIDAFCLPANPAAGFVPSGPPFCTGTGHFSQVIQTINFSRIITRGIEGVAEVDVPLGSFGSLTPFFSFSTLHAQNKNPDSSRLAVINAVYNSSAPLTLKGSASDVPFYSQPNWQMAFAPRLTGKNGRWWAEYEWRKSSRITRVDPQEIAFGGIVTYSYFASYKGYEKQSIRGGFTLAQDKQYPVRVTLGVENLTDKMYFLPFQPAPAPGRSFIVGTTIPLSKKW